MQAPPQGAPHDARTATRGCLPQADGGVGTSPQPETLQVIENAPRRGQDPALQRPGINRRPAKPRFRHERPRAACRPPLRPAATYIIKTGRFQRFSRRRPVATHTIKMCRLCRFVGRGLDPAAGTFRQTRHTGEIVPFPSAVGAACRPPVTPFPRPNTLRETKTRRGTPPYKSM